MVPTNKRRVLLSIISIFISLLLILICVINNLCGKEPNELEKLIKKVEYMQNSEIQGGKTYYVSSSGTSNDGTNINDPMSLASVNAKTFQGNDKILFKRGDIFYGILKIDSRANSDNMLYIGCYGEKNEEKPIISGAAILENVNAWEYQEGLYLLDLSKQEDFSGIDETYKENYNVRFYKR